MSDSFDLDSVPWAHQTPTLGALGFRFAVRVTDAALGCHLDTILGWLRIDGAPDHLYSLVDQGEAVQPRYPLHFDGERIAALRDPAAALSYLLWHVNSSAVKYSPQYLLIHASAVEHDGAGVVMPAPSGSGKTTLAAGLVRSGMRYLTDEAVAVDPATARLVPYPKALSVKRGSHQALADLVPRLAEKAAAYAGGQWHLPPEAIRPGAVSPGCQARLVVAPRYAAGETTRLEPLSPAQGLVVLAENAFNLRLHGAGGLAVLGEVVATCDCFRLVVGDLDAACRTITDLLVNRVREDAP